MKKIYLIFLFLISISPSLYGEEGYVFKELYEIEVELNGSDRDSINEGMKLAFKDLMLSLSSNSEINTFPAIVRAVRDSEKYISEYRLSSEEENILAVFSFNGEEVRKLLSDNSLPLWIGIKPKVLLFLPCKSDAFLMIDHQEILVKRQEMCSEIKSTLSKRGLIRNIVFIEPVLDLIDLKYINLYEPRSDQEFLNKISLRYGLKDWMICYIQNEYGIFIPEFLCLSPASDFKKISSSSMVDLLADELSKDFQLNIDPNIRSELKMSVSGVEEYNHLLSLEKIIESNALVDSYSINSISNHTVTYLLSIRGQISDLEKLMNVNPLLLGQPIKKGEADLEYSFKVEK
ncbi:MAG: hypothetical protein Ct9H300mP3_02970 [Gammaproteobacteria bacterium]|nr:MAG: hypothetical protein Ct9H300mP3_02970 [Gammaproteobacteria bacterium]